MNCNYGSAIGLTYINAYSSDGQLDTFTFSLGVDDPFGRKGDQFAILAGMPPRLNGGLLIEQFDQVFPGILKPFIDSESTIGFPLHQAFSM